MVAFPAPTLSIFAAALADFAPPTSIFASASAIVVVPSAIFVAGPAIFLMIPAGAGGGGLKLAGFLADVGYGNGVGRFPAHPRFQVPAGPPFRRLRVSALGTARAGTTP